MRSSSLRPSWPSTHGGRRIAGVSSPWGRRRRDVTGGVEQEVQGKGQPGAVLVGVRSVADRSVGRERVQRDMFCTSISTGRRSRSCCCARQRWFTNAQCPCDGGGFADGGQARGARWEGFRVRGEGGSTGCVSLEGSWARVELFGAGGSGYSCGGGDGGCRCG